jgi:hypothetical protein
VLRLYAEYTGPSGASAATQAGAEIAQYTAEGFQIELALRYRPSEEDASVAVPGFVDFVGATVDQLGANPHVVALQVTNEANVAGAPNASDGYYSGAEEALIRGVERAKSEIIRSGDRQLKVGFNWAYQVGASENAFWRYLGERGRPGVHRSAGLGRDRRLSGDLGPLAPKGKRPRRRGASGDDERTRLAPQHLHAARGYPAGGVDHLLRERIPNRPRT